MSTENELPAPTHYNIAMGAAEYGAIRHVVEALMQFSVSAREINKLKSRVLDYSKSLYALRTGERLVNVHLHSIETVFIAATGDVMHHVVLEKKE